MLRTHGANRIECRKWDRRDGIRGNSRVCHPSRGGSEEGRLSQNVLPGRPEGPSEERCWLTPDVFPPQADPPPPPPHLPAGAAATAESLTLVSESVSECPGVSRVGKPEAEAGEQEGSSEARPGSG